jgi:hypothetical protein
MTFWRKDQAEKVYERRWAMRLITGLSHTF